MVVNSYKKERNHLKSLEAYAKGLRDGAQYQIFKNHLEETCNRLVEINELINNISLEDFRQDVSRQINIAVNFINIGEGIIQTGDLSEFSKNTLSKWMEKAKNWRELDHKLTYLSQPEWNVDAMFDEANNLTDLTKDILYLEKNGLNIENENPIDKHTGDICYRSTEVTKRLENISLGSFKKNLKLQADVAEALDYIGHHIIDVSNHSEASAKPLLKWMGKANEWTDLDEKTKDEIYNDAKNILPELVETIISCFYFKKDPRTYFNKHSGIITDRLTPEETKAWLARVCRQNADKVTQPPKSEPTIPIF